MTRQAWIANPANRRRAQSGKAALGAHIAEAGDNDDQNDNLTSLLTDLRHWAAQHNISFAKALRRSRNHFEAEGIRPDDIELTAQAGDALLRGGAP